MPGPDDIIAMSDALDQIQESQSEKTTNSEAIDNVGKNVVNSSLYGVENKPPKVKPTLTSPEKSRLKNKMDIVVESWFKLKKKYETDDKGKTIVAEDEEDGEDGGPTKEGGKKAGKGLMSWLTGLMSMLGMGKGPLIKMLGKWLWKGIKWGGSKIWGALKGVGKAAWGAIKAGFKGVGTAFSNLWKGFKGSSMWKGLTSAVSSGLKAAGNVFNAAKTMLGNALKKVGGAAAAALSSLKPPKPPKPPGGGGGGKPPKPPKPAAPPKLKWWQKAGKWVGSKAKSVVKGVATVATGAKDLAVKGYKAGKAVVKKGVDFVSKFAIKPAKAMVGSMLKKVVGSGGKGVTKFLGGAAKKLPIIGPAIQALFSGLEIIGLKKKFAAGELTRDELEEQIGGVAIKGITAAVGSGLGAFMGGLVSLGTGPFAPLVAWIPMILGSLVGDVLGKWVGGLLTKYVIPPSATKSIGRFFGGLGKKEGEKPMQDWLIMKGGRVIPFSSKDEVLGMKKGGAISQLLGEDRDKDRSSKGRWISNLLGRSRDNIDKLLGRSKDSISKLLGTWKKTKTTTPKLKWYEKVWKSTRPDAPTRPVASGIHSARIAHAEPEGGSDRLAKLQISAIDLSNKYLYQIVQLTQALVKKSGGNDGGGIVNITKPSNSSSTTQGDPEGPSFTDSRVEFYNSPYSMHTPGTVT